MVFLDQRDGASEIRYLLATPSPTQFAEAP